MKKKQIISLLTIAALIAVPFLMHAQPPDGGGDPGAPIDGGLSILLAAGAAYGVKKYREGIRD